MFRKIISIGFFPKYSISPITREHLLFELSFTLTLLHNIVAVQPLVSMRLLPARVQLQHHQHCPHRELENMVHGGRPLPSNPAAARPPILWAEDFVAIAGSLPLMEPQGGLKPLPESGPYVQPVSFQGATALHLAAFYGHLAVTDLLLAAGACDVTARNIQVTAQLPGYCRSWNGTCRCLSLPGAHVR